MTIIYISGNSLLLCLNCKQQLSESWRTAWQLFLRRQKNNKEKNQQKKVGYFEAASAVALGLEMATNVVTLAPMVIDNTLSPGKVTKIH